MSDDIERLIATFAAAIRDKPNYAYNLAGLAEVVADKKEPLRALEIARDAISSAADSDPRAVKRARAVMANLIPSYHVPMMNDVRRNEAWDAAIRHAIKPGMHVFEIGTGAGMLALMAARAGATVTTCETHAVVARLARELAERNGFADKITLLEKSSRDVQPSDLPRPADFLFCDIFADNLFDFDPFSLIADAKARLLVPGAPIIPGTASMHVALGLSTELSTGLGNTCGFDLSPMRDFVAAVSLLKTRESGVRLLSPPLEAFRFSAGVAPRTGRIELQLQANSDCEVNGVARWIRLDLDNETSLEARPGLGLPFFSSAMFVPFASRVSLRAGDILRVGLAYSGKVLETWLAGRG